MDHLLQVLKARDIALSSSDVQQGLKSTTNDEELDAWVEEYLSTDTLLSSDELRIWEKLKRQKQHDSGQHLRSVSDSDLQKAVESLQSSTAAVERQQKVLESQRAALQALRRRNVSTDIDGGSGAHQRQVPAVEDLTIGIEQSQQSLDEDFTAISEHVASTIRSVASYASERLNADDKSLDAIMKLNLSDNLAGSDVDVKTIDQWCSSLILFRTVAIKSQIEQTYNSALDRAVAGLDGQSTSNADLEEQHALQAEMESLREEIASVNEMVIDHEFRKTITASIEASQATRKQAQKEWLEYISSSLQYIAKRADALSKHASELRSFQEAVKEIKQTLATHIRTATTEPANPPKLERNMSGLRPLLLTRTASGTIDTDDPLRLLRALDADIDIGKDGTTATRFRAVLASKLSKAEAQHSAAEGSNLQVLGEYLSYENKEMDDALGALYAHTAFKAKNMSDLGLVDAMQRLESKVDHVGRGISEVESEQAEELPPKARELLNRYRT